MHRFDRSQAHHRVVRRARRAASASALALALVAVAATGAFAQTQGGGPGGLGGSGTLTGRSGSTLEIEGFMGTTKVIVNSSTEYRQTADTDATAITKGACIRVSGDGDTSKAVDATTVAVLDSAQMCSARRTTRGGSFPNGGNPPNGGSLPNGGSFPNGGSPPNGGSLPTDGSRPQGAFGGGVTGTVKSIDGDTVVVTARVPKQSSTGNSQPKLVKRNVKVTLADATTITHNVDATDSVLVVGTCLSSEGSTDSVGTVTAKKVTAAAPDSSGSCNSGFGGFPGGPPSTSTSGAI